MRDIINFIICCAIGLGLVALVFYGLYLMPLPLPSYIITSECLRECMDIAVAFEGEGDLELRELMRVSVKDNEFTSAEYIKFMERKESIVNRKAIEYFNDGTYKYMDENIGLNLPNGYERNK